MRATQRIEMLHGLVAVFLLTSLLGCQIGRMAVQERHYLAVFSGENTNYYRVDVDAETWLGDAKYDSGWFPAYSVDRLYGNTSGPTAASQLKAEQDVRTLIDGSTAKVWQGKLNAAADPATSEQTFQAWLLAEGRLRASAGDGLGIPRDAIEIEYAPTGNIRLRHAGEKLLFVLASKPDEVIGAIQRFASDAQTGATVLRMADVIRQQTKNEVDQALAENAADAKLDNVIVGRIDAALALLQGNPDRDGLLAEVESLLFLIENAR